MDIKIRRLITIVFFGIFFAVSPLLLLYAAGFRYDFSRGVILRTGNILVEAKDLREADIYIDGEKYKDQLTRRLFIKNLLPGEYNLRIEKADRHPWEKLLRVEPSLTTFVIDLVLFLKSDPRLIVEKQINSFKLSPTGKDLAYRVDAADFSEVFVYNLEYGQEQLVYRTAEDPQLEIDWAPSGNRLMIRDKSMAAVFRTNTTPALQLYSTVLDENQQPAWDGNSDNFIYLAGQNAVKKIDISKQASEIFYQPQSAQTMVLPQFLGNEQAFLILEKTATQTNLILVNNLLNGATVLAELPGSENYKFIAQTKDYVAVAETEQKKIHIVKKRSSLEPVELLKEKTITVDGRDASFSPDGKKLLVISDYELSYLNLESFDLRLINRFGRKISGASWYEDNLHVVIDLGDQIMASDLSIGAENLEQVTLVGGTHILQTVLHGEDTIYFIAGGDVPGLYSLQIR